MARRRPASQQNAYWLRWCRARLAAGICSGQFAFQVRFGAVPRYQGAMDSIVSPYVPGPLWSDLRRHTLVMETMVRLYEAPEAKVPVTPEEQQLFALLVREMLARIYRRTFDAHTPGLFEGVPL